jgi:hypothetical protein
MQFDAYKEAETSAYWIQFGEVSAERIRSCEKDSDRD